MGLISCIIYHWCGGKEREEKAAALAQLKVEKKYTGKPFVVKIKGKGQTVDCNFGKMRSADHFAAIMLKGTMDDIKHVVAEKLNVPVKDQCYGGTMCCCFSFAYYGNGTLAEKKLGPGATLSLISKGKWWCLMLPVIILFPISIALQILEFASNVLGVLTCNPAAMWALSKQLYGCCDSCASSPEDFAPPGSIHRYLPDTDTIDMSILHIPEFDKWYPRPDLQLYDYPIDLETFGDLFPGVTNEERSEERSNTSEKQDMEQTLQQTLQQYGRDSIEYKMMKSMYQDQLNNVKNWDCGNSKTKIVPKSPVQQYLTVKVIGGPMAKDISWNFDLKKQNQIYIGTDENENDIVLVDDDVDSEHAALCFVEENNQFLLMDRESDGTSKVNGNAVDCETPVELETGDEIALGSNTVLVVSLTAVLPQNWQVTSKTKSKKKELNKDVVQNWEAAEQLRNPKDVFNHFDTDNDGSLAPDEVREALNYLGCEMSEKKFTKFFAKCDKNKDGTLSFKEFKKSLYVCERGCCWLLVFV